MIVSSVYSEGAVSEAGALTASPGNLLEMPILRFCPRPSESETAWSPVTCVVTTSEGGSDTGSSLRATAVRGVTHGCPCWWQLSHKLSATDSQIELVTDFSQQR